MSPLGQAPLHVRSNQVRLIRIMFRFGCSRPRIRGVNEVGTRSGKHRETNGKTRNVLDLVPIPSVMEEGPIPGSRVRATTKHGTLTVDEIAAMQPGMARLMDELSRRYWVLYYAAKAGNWELAAYMARESEKILQTASVARPKYRDDIASFVRERLGPIARAIDAKDWRTFDAAYHRGIDDSNVYHDKYNKRFIRFRLPDHPPEWFDLTAR